MISGSNSPGAHPRDPICAGYRYLAEPRIYAVWLYFRFLLSLRLVEEMLASRSPYEAIWGLKFGPNAPVQSGWTQKNGRRITG
jgi:hypothetical protein